MTPQQRAQHNDNLERKNREQLEEQEEQSSFFPFSDQGKPRTTKPSPFKLALKARKKTQGTSEFETEGVLANLPANPSSGIHGGYGMSSESIYSRTTDAHAESGCSPKAADERMMMSSKRMVSDFLRSRRNLQNQKENDPTGRSSPAFL